MTGLSDNERRFWEALVSLLDAMIEERIAGGEPPIPSLPFDKFQQPEEDLPVLPAQEQLRLARQLEVIERAEDQLANGNRIFCDWEPTIKALIEIAKDYRRMICPKN